MRCSGRISLTNTALAPHTRCRFFGLAIGTHHCQYSEATDGTWRARYSWTSTQEALTALAQGRQDNCGLSSPRPERGSIGREVATPGEPNLSIPCEKKKKRYANVCKASSCAILFAVALTQAWELSGSGRSAKSTFTTSRRRFFHHPVPEDPALVAAPYTAVLHFELTTLSFGGPTHFVLASKIA